MLHHAAPPSHSSHSDIANVDRVASSLPCSPSSTQHSFAPPISFSPAPRSASISAPMGQTFSKSEPPVTYGSSPATSASSKLKRAFVGRRKKSEDVFAGPSSLLDSRSQHTALSLVPSPSTDSRRIPSAAKQLTHLASSTLNALSGKKSLPSPRSSGLPPPPPPPKPIALQVLKTEPVVVDISRVHHEPSGSSAASSVVTSTSPPEGIEQLEREFVDREMKELEKDSQKEDWRKSDSTMASHSTIRPGGMGSRSPRPVSIAESLQSTSTIVPANKRLSALLTDAEFAPLEEDVVGYAETTGLPTSLPVDMSVAAMKSRNRRSISLNLGASFAWKPKASNLEPPSQSVDGHVEMAPRSDVRPISPPAAGSDVPTLTRTAAHGIISPLRDPHAFPASASRENVRGRLTGWDSSWSAPSSPPPPRERGLPQAPPSHPQRPSGVTPHSPPPSFRQTAISMSTGFAPAAGIAMGFGKRAVEKMGRAWGGLNSSSSSSGYTSSSSGTAPSSYTSGGPLGRLHSNHSNPSQTSISSSHLSKSKPRRTPNAPSATWSINSSGTSSSLSESENYSIPSAPTLGKCVRSPLRSTASGGLVFGRRLQSCVDETALDSVKLLMHDSHTGEGHQSQRSGGMDMEVVGAKALENRMLPALVVRCAQHLLKWGMQEEGLFRVSGRSSHIAKLRVEFDTGADYDMAECSPGDLDPHAVASIFKAYLRELPEPILTHPLIPYFDAALSAEISSTMNNQERSPFNGGRGAPLPSSPRNPPTPLRKPPSLSTLALPNLSGMRPPSQPLLNALSSLIARLPRENRDLLRTAAELIKETARCSKDTKMPLSNLLLVFCPSLNMNPPLLKVLCEAEGIWNGPLKGANDPFVIDIKREETPVIEIGPVGGADYEAGDAEVDDVDEQGDEEGLVLGEVDGVDDSDSDSIHDIDERPLPTIPGVDSASSSSSQAVRSTSPSPYDFDTQTTPTTSETTSLKDDAHSYTSASDVPSTSTDDRMYLYSPPPLTSSVDSLATPSTLSEDPSLPPHPVTNCETDEKPVTSFVRSSPDIADTSFLPLAPARPRPPHITLPIPFPSDPGSAPPSPSRFKKSPRQANVSDSERFDDKGKVKTPSSPSWTSMPSPRLPRIKKPSLHLLFTKRSSSSGSSSMKPALPGSNHAPSPYLHSPPAASSASVSSPGTAVTAPQTSTFSLPPQLEMAISGSPIKLQMNLGGNNSRDEYDFTMTDEDPIVPGMRPDSAFYTPDEYPHPLRIPLPRTMSTSTYMSAQETPIADFYRRSQVPSVSLPCISLRQQEEGVPEPSSSQHPLHSSTSLDRLGVKLRGDGDESSGEEDWAKSVLKATESGTDLRGWRVKEAMKVFESGSSRGS
ncbi:hypothetical protein JAAARDRAFT_193890 [Jaapia argillacea MUCL 33604]|uniref:Rho-GAP domain-containing protein n=1 Tax=Jaapia argillacea MUCL 33604 TaxID=933084 RepID=A0A067Q274_9AGAM|nr:hypothetical protein JAAARDRAFT_193890 [Jaapia argillacea MUCL 33604]